MTPAATIPTEDCRPPPLTRLQMILLAGAVALAGLAASTAPARANDDVVRFLLGAAALAVIVGAVDDRHRARHLGNRVLPDSCRETARVRGRSIDIYNARCLRRAGYRSLPQQCHVDLRTHHGRRAGYVAHCLQQAGYRAEGHALRPHRPQHSRPQRHHRRPDVARLPARCEMHYRHSGQRVWGFDGRCLSRHGLTDLPRRCMVRDHAGNRYFNGQCLTNAGYRRGR